MRPFKPTRRSALLLGTTLLVNWLPLGCKSADKTLAEPTTKPDQSYQVRGIVERIDLKARIIDIQHEAIPQFINQSGEAVGMAAMTMPFHLSPHIDPSELRVGDKVEFSLDVRWGEKQELHIPRLTRLPAEADLRVE